MNYLNRAMKEDFASALCAVYLLAEFMEDKEYWKAFGSKTIFPKIKRRIDPIKQLLSELIKDVDEKQKDSLLRFIEDSRIALVSKASAVANASKTSFYDQAAVEHLADAVTSDNCTFCQLNPDETRECQYRKILEELGIERVGGISSNGRCPYAR